jgi:hypothetical protein
MLPPHRPFREKPATARARAKKQAPARPAAHGASPVRGVRRDLKPELLVVDREPAGARSLRVLNEARS